MINKTTTIQEITAQAIEGRFFDFLYEEKGLSRDQIFSLFAEWGEIFERAHEGYEWEGDYYDEIDRFLEFCEWNYKHGAPITAERFIQPRVTIGFCVKDHGSCVADIYEEFPKPDEDMEHGTEFEYYYSLREMTNKILALKVGESIPFKIRDDKDSVGSVTRLK